ncbi:MAG: Nif11-like leader peptide family natural product precursor [Mogibacterium sp.]|nr:Nif11-like leader peptide family natural product precursor [Oscillospiraceae bacterium]MBR7088317.1 Nif11-like leader peptide family natural product precursor [Mogibacterium sp.]
MNEAMNKVFSDEAFMKELLAADSAESAQKMLEDKGVNMSIDEITQLGEYAEKVISGEITAEEIQAQESDELSDDDLENVAGGFAITAACVAVGGFLLKMGVAAGVGAVAYAGVEAVVNIRRW